MDRSIGDHVYGPYEVQQLKKTEEARVGHSTEDSRTWDNADSYAWLETVSLELPKAVRELSNFTCQEVYFSNFCGREFPPPTKKESSEEESSEGESSEEGYSPMLDVSHAEPTEPKPSEPKSTKPKSAKLKARNSKHGKTIIIQEQKPGQ